MFKVSERIYALTAILFVIVVILYSFGIITPYIASAESSVTYSEVLYDLKKDESFSESYYPYVENDYSLQIIQIAESTDNELLIYVYQPSGQDKDFRASSINISTTVNDNISYYNYKLQFCNSSGVFYKYLVKDFTVIEEPTRYYAISSVYRPYDETIDEETDHGNTVTEVVNVVNKQYCFSVINGQPYCSVVDIETIVVTDKFVGFVRYSDGFKLYVGACDSHFVAFDTDKPIDKLLEADVYYTMQSYSSSNTLYIGRSESFGEKTDEYAYLKYTQRVEHNGGGLFAGTYTWDRIETVEQFIAENDLTQNVYSGAVLDVNTANKISEEGKVALSGKKWVLRFVETSYTILTSDYSTSVHSTIVGDVTILRLKFETDGVTYNLGVIDNKQTGSNKPINNEELEVEANDNWKYILTLLLLILLLVFFSPALIYIVRAVVWLISLPFKAIGKSIKRRK